ncbi:hypothetical protein M419DRAFT_23761 [Trichoderma reesei RUT C-30]|uniref:Nephrocystin 3-like N-terminal domain-containing protein n=1 Tax=Hypocrea jecorina (strain ATCC 56765 / BCRC 32924 / NRRL 11460 / Rut C-30) TaxID=1344414 RepID=A0A024SJ59_HYPJR|nr:hypothetical protein M419DRAFT_23761 [Trichoderma reesei RUT C-30]
MASESSSMIPPIHLQPPSVDFIDNQLPQHHGVFRNTNAHFDHMLQRYVSDTTSSNDQALVESDANGEATNELAPLCQMGDVGDPEKFWGLVFTDAMTAFVTKYPNEPDGISKLGYSIRSQTTWKGINDQLHKARQVYDGSQKQFRGWCKRTMRKIGDNAAEPATNIISLIPNIEYVSPVLGAVQLLLNAYKVASEVREKVTSSFDETEVQELFNNAEVYIITFPDSSRIKDSTIALVVAVMKAIEDAIGFFLSKQKVQQFQMDTKQDSKQTKVVLNDIHQFSAEACNNVLIMLNDAEENKKRQMQILANQENILNRLAIMEEISRASTPVPPDPSITWQSQHIASFNSQFQLYAAPPVHYHTYFQPIQQPVIMQKGQIAWFDALADPNYPRPISPQRRIVNSSSILEILIIPLNLDSVDLQTVKDYSYRLPRKYHARAVQVTQTREFRQWIVTPTSTRLLIHGDFSPHGLDSHRVSPLSFFCFLLVHMLRARERYITLVFFCGFHVEEEDGNVGGAAMMRSFIAQLLQQMGPSLIQLDMSTNLESIAKGDCDICQLCGLFVQLVRQQLPRDRTLVCIIDGIGDYETDELQGDMLAVMRTLLQFRKPAKQGHGAEQSSHGDMKVLVTTPFSTEAVQELFLGESDGDEDELAFLTMESFPDVNDTVGIGMPVLFMHRENSVDFD